MSEHSVGIWYLKWEKYRQKGMVEEEPITYVKAHTLEEKELTRAVTF